MGVYKDDKTASWFCKFYFKDWQGDRHQTTKRGFKTKGMLYAGRLISLQKKIEACIFHLKHIFSRDIYKDSDGRNYIYASGIVGRKRG